MKDTLVIGASINPERYSNKAVRTLLQHGFPVIALGLKNGHIDTVPVETERKPWSNIGTVSLYIGPDRQKDYYDYVLSLKPDRVIFNPGTENAEFAGLLRRNNCIAEEACTIVLVNTDQYIR